MAQVSAVGKEERWILVIQKERQCWTEGLIQSPLRSISTEILCACPEEVGRLGLS